ncbi:hypothetical protein HYDPIDRAFT_115682 [Hydnomerulius pinastri MD-312]|uniref:Ricin B lectin domain-containing protein n=1 Tax=Hydnomerulius pinastri MD-312 TaxID=994086 RepID=A0A0C9VU45_9AGAM|nr:hypothetical protein HYDPIDRAFT_115682 [Hydnomerulius pinastri MD-312]
MSVNFHVPPGTYVVMDAATHTYLNVLNSVSPNGAIVCSVGNHAGNDIWNIMPTETHQLTIQSYGTGDFLSVNAGKVVTSTTIYPWSLIENKDFPYAFSMVDARTGQALRVGSYLNGAPVTLVDYNEEDPNQAWFFVGKEPTSDIP